MEASPPIEPRFTALATSRAAGLKSMHGDEAVAAAQAQLRYARELGNADYLVLCQEICAIVELEGADRS